MTDRNKPGQIIHLADRKTRFETNRKTSNVRVRDRSHLGLEIFKVLSTACSDVENTKYLDIELTSKSIEISGRVPLWYRIRIGDDRHFYETISGYPEARTSLSGGTKELLELVHGPFEDWLDLQDEGYIPDISYRVVTFNGKTVEPRNLSDLGMCWNKHVNSAGFPEFEFDYETDKEKQQRIALGPARDLFMRRYCKDRNWHPSHLTPEQRAEIEGQRGWINP
ncbi:MAG: hypothetical protein HY912_24475 [Desulfomonile tiedjei]|uniref:Uncharacterized protein n=1 Tax=Desulfomonile tiedjei TaxID=2358 RepID=A0A9D6V6X1_9BACT|nr:hypothetical protein [Desulfomonile tiedjei]